MKRNLVCIAATVIISSLCAALVSKYYVTKSQYVYTAAGETIYKNVELTGGFPDFTYAAENSVNGVVHVKVLKREEAPAQATILQHFFGYGVPQQLPRESVNSGSGVIIAPDGYIVTNNHVVAGAAEILVTMNNNKSFNATIVGTDPVTDIALLKVDAENLPVIPVGSSEQFRLGEWVLAIGSPFNLKSTITSNFFMGKSF